MKPKIAAIIPARLASSRFPEKVLYKFSGLTMIEHVWFRAILSNAFNAGVYVCTCDQEIFDLINNRNGNCIMTSSDHNSGTSRVSEAIEKVDCSHVVIIQGDEPLILPSELKKFANEIKDTNKYSVWNAVTNIKQFEDMNDSSIVKCSLNVNNEIMFMYRRNPYIGSFKAYSRFSKKVLGLIGFKKSTLKQFKFENRTLIEDSENIEQLHILFNNVPIMSVNLGESSPSVNLPEDAFNVKRILSEDLSQIDILKLYE